MIAIAKPEEIATLEADRDYFIDWAETLEIGLKIGVQNPDRTRTHLQRLRRTAALIQRAIDELQPR